MFMSISDLSFSEKKGSKTHYIILNAALISALVFLFYGNLFAAVKLDHSFLIGEGDLKGMGR